MEKIWNAKWILDKDFRGVAPLDLLHKQMDNPALEEHRADLKNRHMLVRKCIEFSGYAGSAYLDITADDYYKLYINGIFVGQGPAPAYHFHYNYNRLDILKYLRKGKNVLAVHVYYQGLVNRVWNSGDYRQGLKAELFIDGSLHEATDSSWKYAPAAEYTGTETFGYETQFVENIDERLKIKGWTEISFDDGLWENAVENPQDDHQLYLQSTPPVAVYEVKPAGVERLGEGHYIIDFGQEITGQFKMNAHGSSGQEVVILCGEELEEGIEKRVRFNLRCNCIYKDIWTLSGEEDVLEHFDYKAFRYVEVIADAGVLRPETFRTVVRHYPLNDDCCSFLSSEPLLNSIWRMCKNGVKYGTQEAFLDCPSREKGQYLGDATITTLSHLYLSGDLRIFKKSLLDFALSSRICPGLMAVAPGSFMQEIADFSLQWPLQLMNYYKHSGDIKFLREMFPVAEGIIKYFKRYQREDGLLENVNEKWNLVDWPQNLRDGYDFDLSATVGDGCHNVINVFFCGAVKLVEEIGHILGIKVTDEFAVLKEAFVKAFYRRDIKLFADSTVTKHTALHSNVIPLFYGLVPKEAEQSVAGLIKDKGLNCGVYISYFLLKGLTGIGEYDLAYRILTSTEEHSWANMLREGASTCFEAWGKEQKWNTSLCHPWASAPIPFIVEEVLGLTPAKPGWEEIAFHPVIPKSLKSLNFEMVTPKGRIKVSIKDGITELQAPEGIAVR